MKRSDAIELYFQKADELTVSKKIYRDHSTELFLWMVKADAVKDDVTSKALSLTGKGKTHIISKQKGVVAGIEELTQLLSKHTSLNFSPLVSDGAHVKEEDVIAEISGENTELLAYERTILNILGRMSGIATKTDSLISSINTIPNTPYIA